MWQQWEARGGSCELRLELGSQTCHHGHGCCCLDLKYVSKGQRSGCGVSGGDQQQQDGGWAVDGSASLGRGLA